MDNISDRPMNGPNIKDGLTGIYSMSWLMSQLSPGGPIKVSPDIIALFFNVMNFKAFNRRFGFEGGNDFLRSLAKELTGIFEGNTIARAGGDHFIVLADNLSDEECERKLKYLDSAMRKHDRGLRMHIKTGIYRSKGDEQSLVVAIDRAKDACDVVNKRYDMDYFFFDEELRKRNELRQYVIEHFEEAFEEDYFTVFYQPVIRTLTGKVCGYEALARWRDPVHGMISPGIFIDVLENVRLIHRLDLYIIEHVCMDLRRSIDEGSEYRPISFNLSRLDFELCDIKEELLQISSRYDIPHELLIIELTESAVASGIKAMFEQVSELRSQGFHVWLDDFGSGYSSFNNLQNYDFDTLKIDMEFVRDINRNPKANAIIASIISMSKRLNLPSLAEGVETREQYEFLKAVGCEKIQGYLFGKPQCSEDIAEAIGRSLFELEPIGLREYYDKASALNLLSSSPLKNFEQKNTGKIYNALPITILECDHSKDDQVSFLYFNDAYVQFLESFGDVNVDNVQEFFGHEGRTQMLKAFRAAELVPEDRISFEVPFDEETILMCKIRLLARENDRSVFGYAVRRKD